MSVIRWVLAVAVLGVAAVLLVGCEDDGLGVLRTCTLIGCDSGVVVHLGEVATAASGTLDVELCVDGECTEQQVRAGDATPLVGLYREPDRWEPGERVHATISVTDETGSVVAQTERTVTLERHEPNGPDCPPTCAQARIDL